MKHLATLLLVVLLPMHACAQNRHDNALVNELWINNGSRKIFGIESVPNCTAKKKVAIVSHGFNGSCYSARNYYDTLNSLGYLVYSMDFPCGSVKSKSDSNTMNMSVLDEKEDVKAVVRYFQKQPDVDKNNIVLVGESQGGLVSALAAAELKDEISSLVLVYPALCIPDNWNDRYKTTKDIPDTTLVWGVRLGRRFFEEVRNIDVFNSIEKYEGRVLIIHGDCDRIVPLDYSERAVKCYRNAHLNVIHGAGHGFKPNEIKVSNGYVKDFFEQN